MQEKYKIKNQFAIIPHSLDRIELRSGVWNPTSFFIQDHEQSGKLYEVIKNLNGSLTSKEIGKKLGIPVSQVEGVIDHLQGLGVLENKQTTELDDFLTTYMPIFSYAEYKYENFKRKILLIGDNILTNSLFTELQKVISKENLHILDHSNSLYMDLKTIQTEDWLYDGISFLDKIEQFSEWKDYFIILAFSTIDPLLAKNFNRIAHELSISWMHVAIDGPFLFIGPTFLGGASPCYECLEKRITMNLREYANYQKYKEALAEKKIHSQNAQINPLILSIISAHAAMEIVIAVSTGSTFTIRKLLGIYLPTMEIAYNELLPLSSCEVCNGVQHRTDEQLYFDMQTLLSK